MSDADTIKFQCFHCKQHIRCPVSMKGEWAVCPSCKGEVVVPKGEQGGAEPKNNTANDQQSSSEKNPYPATTVIIVANKILGVCSFVLGILISFVIWAKTQSGASFLVGLVLSAVVWLIFRSAAEALQVFLDIEKNTRKTSEALLEYLKNKG